MNITNVISFNLLGLDRSVLFPNHSVTVTFNQ